MFDQSESRTFVGHPRACLQEELLAGAAVNLLNVVAQRVAAILAAVQADAFVEGTVVPAPVRHDLFVLVEQRVDEQMDGALVSALDCLLEACDEKHKEEDDAQIGSVRQEPVAS